jgi:pimeloyl-ACP methyl ester carboxylesterase
MQTVTSRDGTEIAVFRSGNGPPLVLVHGTTADHTRWASILPELERHFTVLAMDRRGRGNSGDGPDYALEREFEDVAAVLDAVGPGANLLGHSYGALCAMEAAHAAPGLSRLVLYEPPFPVGIDTIYPPGTRERFESLLAAGEREALLETFFRDVVGMPPPHIDALRADPSWPARIAAAHTLVRELADDDYVFDPDRFSTLTAPTLLLKGEHSPPEIAAATDVVHAALPNARVTVLEGQGHVAMTTAPELFLREVIGFLTDPAPLTASPPQ